MGVRAPWVRRWCPCSWLHLLLAVDPYYKTPKQLLTSNLGDGSAYRGRGLLLWGNLMWVHLKSV